MRFMLALLYPFVKGAANCKEGESVDGQKGDFAALLLQSGKKRGLIEVIAKGW